MHALNMKQKKNIKACESFFYVSDEKVSAPFA